MAPLPPTTSALLAAATNISPMEAKQKLHPGLPLPSIINKLLVLTWGKVLHHSQKYDPLVLSVFLASKLSSILGQSLSRHINCHQIKLWLYDIPGTE